MQAQVMAGEAPLYPEAGLDLNGDASGPTERFRLWVKTFKVKRLARHLKVERSVIYAWIDGLHEPGKKYRSQLIRLSRRWPLGIGPLALEDVLGPVED